MNLWKITDGITPAFLINTSKDSISPPSRTQYHHALFTAGRSPAEVTLQEDMPANPQVSRKGKTVSNTDGSQRHFRKSRMNACTLWTTAFYTWWLWSQLGEMRAQTILLTSFCCAGHWTRTTSSVFLNRMGLSSGIVPLWQRLLIRRTWPLPTKVPVRSFLRSVDNFLK